MSGVDKWADKHEQYDDIVMGILNSGDDPRSDGGILIEVAKVYAMLAQAAATRLVAESMGPLPVELVTHVRESWMA